MMEKIHIQRRMNSRMRKLNNMSTIILQDGHTYRTRDGEQEVTVEVDEIGRFRSCIDGCEYPHHCNGRIFHNQEHAYDLVEEVMHEVEVDDDKMTMRDEFAKSIIGSLYSELCKRSRCDGCAWPENWEAGISRDAYRIADAMIEARKVVIDKETGF
jgi:hypothetical protein